MRVRDSSEIFKRLSLAYLVDVSPPQEPDLVSVTFSDVVPAFKKEPSLSRLHLYRHQLEAFLSLSAGMNVILVSGTGSGKTEAWVLYVLHKNLKTLAIYPNLALSADQLRRIKRYGSLLNFRVMEVNAEVAKIFQQRGEKVFADIIITNPAYLMTEIKSGGRVLDYFLRDIDLIVVDELAYYGSSRASLLLKMLELLMRYMCYKKPQIIILTATLGNPEVLASMLKNINQRDTKVISGKPRCVENRAYIILGKEHPIRSFYGKLTKMDLPFIRKDQLTIENFFSIILNLDIHLSEDDFWEIVPHEIFDWSPEDILVEYINDDGVTLVFTDTIESAEMYAKRVREKCRQRGINCEELVKTHHHLVFKEERERIEKGAREGKVKLIFSPRTLEQGIDIGTVVRVIHIGLPLEVRQFLQREGRKGRRPEIPFTETVIIPIKEFDRVVLRAGFKSLREWITLGNEQLIIRPNNLLLKLFSALYKLFRLNGRGFDEKEKNLLLSLDLAYEAYGALKPKRKGLYAWANFQFYQFGEPIGVSRFLFTKEEKRILPEISRGDLIDRFQIGYIDPQTEGVVVDMGTPSHPAVTEIYMNHMYHFISRKKFKRENISYLEKAIKKYYAIKKIWGEDANLISDYRDGYLEARTLVSPSVPNGFGIITYRAMGVNWILESRKKRPFKVGDNILYLKDIKVIPVSGFELNQFRYHDFTYGYKLSFQDYKPRELLAAFVLITAYLRISRQISLRDLNCCTFMRKRDQTSYVIIWETQSTGLLESLDYENLIREMENLKMTGLIKVLIRMIDKSSYLEVLLNETVIKKLAVEILKKLKEVVSSRKIKI